MHAAKLESMPALVLNADYRPLSYNPLSLWSWEDAVKAVTSGKATAVESYDRIIRSPSFEMFLPSVIALNDYVSPSAEVRFTRFNVFLRDNFTCLYCGDRKHTSELTFEHVIPRSRGGPTNWHNIATACVPCNQLKADSVPEEVKFPAWWPKPELAGKRMKLLYKPYVPSQEQLRRPNRLMYTNLHKDWLSYLYWDTDLERDQYN